MHLGSPAFLGISIADTSVQGAAVASVLDGGPAQGAGITQGDVITAIAGTTIGSATDLQSALLQHKPGQTVNVIWTDQSGQSHTTNVTLATGPAL